VFGDERLLTAAVGALLIAMRAMIDGRAARRIVVAHGRRPRDRHARERRVPPGADAAGRGLMR
jgi:hypothetical protein